MTKTTCSLATRPCWRRLTLGAVVAVALGIGFAAFGGYVVSDFAATAAGEESADSVYLVNVPQDEELLRTLSQQLMQGSETDPAALGEIAPAAGAPLGRFETR